MKFPKLSHIVADDKHGKHSMKYAAVLNGRIQASNRHGGVYLNAKNYIKPEQLEKAEGKVFDFSLLSVMGEATDMDFTDTQIIIKFGEATSVDGEKTIREFYSGKIDPETKQILKYDELFDDYEEESGDYFEGLESVLSLFLKGSTPDVPKIQKRNTYFRGVMFDHKLLESLTSIMPFKDPDKKYIGFDYFHADASKKNVERPSAPILISPVISAAPIYDDLFFMMPYFPAQK